jgi:hypothetical protein
MSHVDTPAIVMWSIKQIAARDGVSKQAVSKKVKALAADHGLQIERDGRNRIVAVNVAAYDHLRGKFGDPSHAQAPDNPPADETPAPVPDSDSKSADSFNEAKRQLAWIDAERARMRFAEEKKQLVRLAGVLEAVSDCGIDIARLINRLPAIADEITAACGGDNSHGARTLLKSTAQKLLADISAAMATIAAETPEFEQEPQGQKEEASPPGAAVE